MFKELKSQRNEILDEWRRHGDNENMFSIISMSQITTKLVCQIDARRLLLRTLEVYKFDSEDSLFSMQMT